MATSREVEGVGHARYTHTLRVSSSAGKLLLAEWARCRWVWNDCVAKSRATHTGNHTRSEGEAKSTCGPAELDKMLTEARVRTAWLREGSSVPQQQTIRDFGKSRAKAPCIWYTPRTPRWTARNAEREPSTHCRSVSAFTPAPCAEPSPLGTRTPHT